jgi:hypothetical protein
LESSHGFTKITILSLLLIFSACNNERAKKCAHLPYRNKFKNGDIICRLGNGYFSNIFKNFSSSEKIYSHIGIIERSNDSVFVIHCEASELTGVGYVKRENINIFLHNINTWALYRFSEKDSIKKGIVLNAKTYYEKKTPFDLKFDLTNDREVYCSELVALCINKSFNDSIIKPRLYLNKKCFYGIDNIYLNHNLNLVFKQE